MKKIKIPERPLNDWEKKQILQQQKLAKKSKKKGSNQWIKR